jgi:hypothetical protein
MTIEGADMAQRIRACGPAEFAAMLRRADREILWKTVTSEFPGLLPKLQVLISSEKAP